MSPGFHALSLLVLTWHVHLAQNIILESIYQKYLKQGLQFRENPFLGNKPILSEYDFIIIGGGTAGPAVANRLSENPNWKILLLESGDDENIYTDIPLLAHFNSLTHFNWGYKLERNDDHPQCLAMYNNQCPNPRGKGLGGSSILNYMIYTRGNKKDYDGYAALGNQGWDYESVQKYFLKSENNTSEFLDADYHSTSGPLKITNIPYPNLLTEKFIQAACEMGYPIYDYTGKDPATEGFSKLQATISKGQRYSASKAYLKSIKKRASKNLHVSLFSHVTRILIDPKTKRAHGVEFRKNGVKRVVLAKKEVILSAGAINSPQLLMLSGIGPEDHLKQFDIDVVSNLKGVGENLNDHHSYFGITFTMNRTNTGSAVEKKDVNMDTFLRWLNLGRGPLTVPGGVTGIGYMNTKYNVDKSWPDTEYLFTIGSFNSDAGRIFRKSMNVRKDIYDSIFGNINSREVWSIIPLHLRPKTRGSIKLKSKNPFKYPKVYYDFFQNEEDAKVMLEAIKNIVKFSETEAFQTIGSKIHKTPIPDCAQYEFGCDDYWKCAMKYFTSTIYHQSGTCKMGPPFDPNAVVNDKLQVYGVTNLRVVDASVFPNIPSAHLYGPTIMVAEKASDMIKESWKSYEENEPQNSGCYSNPGEYQHNKPVGRPCRPEPEPNPCHSSNQLDNQKCNPTTTKENVIATSKPSVPVWETSTSKVPNQANFVETASLSTTTTTTTTEVPYVETIQPSTTTTVASSSFSGPYPPQSPNPSENNIYPSYEPSTHQTIHPTPDNLPNPVSASIASQPQQPTIINQQVNTYPPQTFYQERPNNVYLPPPPQVNPPNQSNGYPVQSNKPPSNTFTYPSDHYHINTIYPGSSSQNNNAFQQGYPTLAHPNPGSFNSNRNNGQPVLPGQHNPSLATNEVVSPNENILFPSKNHPKHPSKQNPVQSNFINQIQVNTPSSISQDRLGPLFNIPYYNQQLNLNQQRFEPVNSPANRTLIPTTIFLNPDMFYSLPTGYFSRRISKTLRKPCDKGKENN